MWNWVSENASALNVVLSFGTMIVWIAYFQILYLSFTRQRRTKVLINRGAGRDVESRCLISNMGAEPLYISSIFAMLYDGDARITAEITDLDESEVGQVDHAREATNQGPMLSGAYMDVGKFSTLIARCLRANAKMDAHPELHFNKLEILVIGSYGAEDPLVGATRSFDLTGPESARKLLPTEISTRQLRSRKARRDLERLIRHYQGRHSPATL